MGEFCGVIVKLHSKNCVSSNEKVFSSFLHRLVKDLIGFAHLFRGHVEDFCVLRELGWVVFWFLVLAFLRMLFPPLLFVVSVLGWSRRFIVSWWEPFVA
jgi:hypothetical protein